MTNRIYDFLWFQASWDAERRDLLRRELLATQLCDAMIPHLRPGCPYRDLAAIRAAATWCDELNRWRLPDVSSVSLRISLPPPAQSRDLVVNGFGSVSKPDHNNNSNSNDNDGERSSADEGGESKPNMCRWKDIANAYFRRNRIDELLAHAREAKSFGKLFFPIGFLKINLRNLYGRNVWFFY